MQKQYLAFNNIQWLICYKTNQPNNQPTSASQGGKTYGMDKHKKGIVLQSWEIDCLKCTANA